MKPNLFKYATKELSQDAFICWLLAWADIRFATVDRGMHAAGKSLLNAMLAKHGIPPREASTVNVIPQFRGLDILILVDSDLAILVEDKVHSGEHSDQLRRYAEAVRTEYPHMTQLPIFAKTGDQSSYLEVEKVGYKLFLRRDFLAVLRTAFKGTTNAILLDFLEHLEAHDTEIRKFLEAPLQEWNDSYFAWVGLYEWLQTEHAADGFEWRHVANPRKGFLGAWWHFRDWNGYPVYMQIEQGNLCFKIGTEGYLRTSAERAQIRDAWRSELLTYAHDRGIELKTPRSGNGTYMTVAAISIDVWLVRDSRDIIDKSATLSYLSNAASLIDGLLAASR